MIEELGSKFMLVLESKGVNRVQFDKSVEFHNDKNLLRKINGLTSYTFNIRDSQDLLAKVDIGKSKCLEIMEYYLELCQFMRQEEMKEIPKDVLFAIIEDKIFAKFRM